MHSHSNLQPVYSQMPIQFNVVTAAVTAGTQAVCHQKGCCADTKLPRFIPVCSSATGRLIECVGAQVKRLEEENQNLLDDALDATALLDAADRVGAVCVLVLLALWCCLPCGPLFVVLFVVWVLPRCRVIGVLLWLL